MKHCIFILLFLMSFLTSCLESNLRDLPLYEEANITSVSAVRYRYYSADDIDPTTNEPIVKEADLSFTSNIDAEAGLVSINVTVPEDFPSSELANLSRSELVVVVSLSTAARLTPTNNSTALGVPGNWENPNTYVVEAANGFQKNWTIEVVSLEK